MDEEQVKEASWTAQSVTGASAYLHGVDFDPQKFQEDLNRIVQHLKRAGKRG